MPPKYTPKHKNQQNLRDVVDDLRINLENQLGRIDGKLTIITNDINHIKDNIINKLLDENATLRERLSKMEIQMERNFQKQRENNLVFSGIPVTITDDVLEKTVIEIIQAVDCPATSVDLQACHRLPSSNPNDKKTIVKFVNRKDAERITKNRYKLKNVDLKQFGDKFTGDERIYVNQNLTPYYSSLAWKCRQLKKKIDFDIESFR